MPVHLYWKEYLFNTAIKQNVIVLKGCRNMQDFRLSQSILLGYDATTTSVTHTTLLSFVTISHFSCQMVYIS
jgi:hypothetical protein